MDSIPATLTITINVTCPNCESDLNLLADDDEGDILKQVLPDERWEVEAEERLKCDVACPVCKRMFSVKGIEW